MKVTKVIGVLVFSVVIIGLSASYAMPPRPGLELPPTDYEEMLRLGVDIVKNPVRDAGKKGIYNTPGDVQPLVSGTKKFPVVCIEYTDYDYTYSTADFQSMLFSNTWTSGSAKKYFENVSYGAFTLDGNSYGWYTSDNIKAYYGYSNGSVRAAMLAKEAAQKADATIDFSQYDNDDDGYVDCFTCIHAGYGREETGSGTDIHSHSWSFSSAGIGTYLTDDGVIIDEYVIDPERSGYSNYGTMVCIGVFCHEWGHALGLPDLYDVSGTGEGLGNWCLMAGGSWGGDGSSPYYPVQMCAWAKMDLGWLSPTAIRSKGLYSMPYVESNAKAYWLIGRQRTFKEYFLVENRRKVLTDTFLYNPGLLIYHIDDSVIARRRGSNAVNSNNGSPAWKYGVALEQADGLDELYSGADRGDANDPWPGGLSRILFDSTATSPNSKTNYPSVAQLVTSCLVKNISAPAATMSCTLSSGVVGQFSGGPDVGGYRWIDSDTTEGPTYSWIDISQTGTVLGNGDENRFSLTLPFNFNFYGTNYTSVWVSTNGWLSYGANPGTNANGNVSIPNSAAPNQAVFAFWDNLNLVVSDNANIYYQNFGIAPNRYCVITWKDARIVGVNPGDLRAPNQVTFQAMLYENSRIVLQYKDCAVGDSTYNWGRSASVGIENSIGSVGLQYLYNGSPIGNLLASERAIQFSSKDIAVSAIESPSGAIDSTGFIRPVARIKNNSNSAISFQTTFRIGEIYSNSRTKTLSAGQEDTVIFASWNSPRGSYSTRCSTYFIEDTDKSNDTLSGSVSVLVYDVGVSTMTVPSDTVNRGFIAPKATVKNYGTQTASFYAYYKVYDTLNNQVYIDSSWVNLNPSNSSTRTFKEFLFNTGRYNLKCSTALAGDGNPSNNVKRDSTFVLYVAPWVLKDSVPYEYDHKKVSSGGSLVTDKSNKIYAFKGYSSRLFYVYYVTENSWVLKESIPYDTTPSSKKRVSRGGSLAYNATQHPDKIYAVKGNNSFEFWAYDVDNDTWIKKQYVPSIVSIPKKPLSGGSCISYARRGSTQYVYLLKGNTIEFYAFNCVADTWVKNLGMAPAGNDPSDQTNFKDGSCMATGKGDTLYVLKGGAKRNQFWSYYSTWKELESLPRYSNITKRKTQVRAGASLCWSGDSFIYAFKGGSTLEFWRYNINRNSWIELDTLPRVFRRNKRVYNGGASTYLNRMVFAMKGNSTYEFWRYTPGISDVMSAKSFYTNIPTGLAISGNNIPITQVKITTNPINENSKIKFTLYKNTKIKLSLYNNVGQLVSTLLDQELVGGAYSLPFNVKTLSAGIYHLRCLVDNEIQTIKVVIK